MAPQPGSNHARIRNLRVSHLKRKAAEELQKGNYGHAADRYSEAITLLLPPPTAAATPLIKLSAPTAAAAAAASSPAAGSNQQSLSLVTAAAAAVAAQDKKPTAPVPAADVPELRALLSNRSLAYLKAGKPAAAADDAAAVITLAPGWHKGHWRLGKASSELSRWSDALDCFSRAWCLADPGSAEQQECEQQLLLVVQKLTRQELADRLLTALASRQQQNAPHALALPENDVGEMSVEKAPEGQLQVGLQTGATVRAVPPPPPSSSAAAALATTASHDVAQLFARCHPEELREAMFQLVKAAQQQQQRHQQSTVQAPVRCKNLNRMQAMLLKWLLLNIDTPSSSSNSSSSNSSSRPKGGAHFHSSILPIVVATELQLLTAQLAVKLKRWSVAQTLTEALQRQLSTMVLPYESVLLQLLVDCHVSLGDAFWADGPNNNSSSSSSGVPKPALPTTALTAQQLAPVSKAGFCQPYKAAAACVTALDLLPVTRSDSSSSSSSSGGGTGSSSSKTQLSFLQLLLRSGSPLASTSAAAAAAGGGLPTAAAAAAAAQLRRDVQHRVDAASEQLTDLEQAAVWATSAAARSSNYSKGTSKTSNSGDSSAAAAAAADVVVPNSHQVSTSSSAAAAAGARGGSVTGVSDNQNVKGWELACLQVCMQQHAGQATQVMQMPPAILVTVTIQAVHPGPSSSSSSSSSISSSSSGARGLSGAARAGLLAGVARAAGVGRLAVGLGQMKLARPAAAATAAAAAAAATAGGRLDSLAIKVQFGADVTAANSFAAVCRSMESLLAACPELAAALVDTAVKQTTLSGHKVQRTCVADASSSSGSADVAQWYDQRADAAAVAAQLYKVAAVEVVDLSATAAAAAAAGCSGTTSKSAGTEHGDHGVQPQQQQQQQQQQGRQEEGSLATSALQPTASSDKTAFIPAENAAAGELPVAGDLTVANPDITSSTDLQAVTADVDTTASAVIPLPYAHYKLVGEDGRAVERPDKHPFALARVLYDARELPTSASEVWFESADGAYRWRQTASTILLQLHALPDYITSAKQLSVTIEPYTLRVQEEPPGPHMAQSLKLAQGQAGGPDYHLGQASGQPGPQSASGELLFEAELARGIVPEDSTWVFVRPEKHSARRSSGTSGSSGGWTAAIMPAANAGGLVGSSDGIRGGTGRHILFELIKMNLELYERPHQHSASWWPRLFADDATDVAWDDAPKNYTDLPPAIAAAAAAEAAREDELRRQQEQRREAKEKLQALVERHMEYRWQRLRELKAAAWNAISSSGSSGSSSSSSSFAN